MDLLVSTEWLAAAMGAGDLILLDATAHPTDPARDPMAEYEAGHIPGALFMDLAGLADPDSDLPGMLPPPDMFAARMGALGLGDGRRVVLYDGSPHHTAARAWWMLDVHGAGNVAILDGGIAKWIAEGRPLESGRRAASPRHFAAGRRADMVRDLAAMRNNLDSGAEQVVDARSPGRFAGREPEPRAGVVPGHIPDSVNLPYDRMFAGDGTWKRGEDLRAAFDAAGVDPSRPLVTTCGSGVTAAVVLFGARMLGTERTALYDGSWSEWGAEPTTPKAVA